ncbi:MAG: hypothetical protein ABWY08_00125 [Comamonas sp.]
MQIGLGCQARPARRGGYLWLGFPSRIKILIGEPIHVTPKEDIDHIRNHLHRLLQEMIFNIS